MKLALAGLGIAAALFYPGTVIALDDVPLRPAEAVAAEVSGSWIPLKATVTAYTSSVDETDGDPNITASGSVAGKGSAACPSKYPFGTKLRINGKIYECEDRMAARYRNVPRFDIWIESKAAAYQWGIRTVTVEIYAQNSRAGS